jgi:hypothetical protein
VGIAETWGSTPDERARPWPCDGLVEGAELELFRAVDVDAPPEVTFRWLCQLREAPYSYDFLDIDFLARLVRLSSLARRRAPRSLQTAAARSVMFARQSPRRLTPGLEQLAVGQRVMRIFRLVKFEHGKHLTLRIDAPAGERIFGDLAVTYDVAPRGERGSRIAVKVTVKPPPSRFLAALGRLLPWGDLMMMRKQLLTLKGLAERERNLLPRRHISS